MNGPLSHGGATVCAVVGNTNDSERFRPGPSSPRGRSTSGRSEDQRFRHARESWERRGQFLHPSSNMDSAVPSGLAVCDGWHRSRVLSPLAAPFLTHRICTGWATILLFLARMTGLRAIVLIGTESEDEEVLTDHLLHSKVIIETSSACGEPKWRPRISCKQGAETAE